MDLDFVVLIEAACGYGYDEAISVSGEMFAFRLTVGIAAFLRLAAVWYAVPTGCGA